MTRNQSHCDLLLDFVMGTVQLVLFGANLCGFVNYNNIDLFCCMDAFEEYQYIKGRTTRCKNN